MNPIPRPVRELSPQSIRSVGIVGAGVMGQGIAQQVLSAGLPVDLFDLHHESTESAALKIEAQRAQPSGAVPPAGSRDQASAPAGSHGVAEAFGAELRVCRTLADVAAADLVIEAVSEKEQIKTELFKQLEPLLSSRTFVATNSSSLPISQLARSWQDPRRFCGMHFCHPVSERPLVEIVGSDTTSSQTLDCLTEFARQIGMSPILVRDAPGFLLNRLLVPYMNEALELLLEGASVEQLEKVAVEFGLPCGPLQHFDEFGIDVALQVGRLLFWKYPDRIVPSELLIAMYKSGRHGRKSGRGFYAHSDQTPRTDGARLDRIEPAVAEMIRDRQRAQRDFTDEELRRRLFLPMLLEALHALESRLIEAPALVDQALRDGLGMTDRFEGLISWLEEAGPVRVLDWLEPLRELGNRYTPTDGLRHMAHEGCSLTAALQPQRRAG